MTTLYPVIGKILALDIGKKRIGLAVCDSLGLTVQALSTLHRKTLRDDILHLERLIAEYEIEMLLIGDPKHETGEASKQSEYVRHIGDLLARVTRLPVRYWDERFTSSEAREILKERGIHDRMAQKGQVDRIAAALLLESYLTEHAQATANEDQVSGEEQP